MPKIDIKVIKEIEDAIKTIDIQRETLLEERKSLEKSKEVLHKVNDFCPVCSGCGYTMKKSRGDDPYERSSDLKETCLRCNGTGRYFK